MLRGDLNSIRVSAFSSIGDRTVVHAARCGGLQGAGFRDRVLGVVIQHQGEQ